MSYHVIPQQFNQSDKIGRFTMPQISILGAIAVIYVLIVISSNFWVSLISFFPLALVAFVLMYFKVNKIPIYEFLFIYLIYMGSPKLLVYRSDNLRSIDEKEEGIGFIDIDKSNVNAPKSNDENQKKSKGKKTSKDSKTTQVTKKDGENKKQNTNIKKGKQPVNTPERQKAKSPRNQTQNKRGTKNISKNRGVRKW